MADSDSSQETAGSAADSNLIWYLRGFRVVASLPALILASSFVGFAALALEAGITLPQAVFMTGIIWALPAKVVLVGAILAGNGLPAAAFAVALSSVRLTPMVVSLVPEIRTNETRSWVLYLLSHFVAVTSWVVAMQSVRNVPRAHRTAWYGGVGSSLVILNMIVVTAVYMVARDLPEPVSAALLLLTPMYFLTSLWGSARERAGKVAMVLGLVLGPLFALVMPEFNLLVTGLVGGTGGYLFHRFGRGATP
jgi:predicted branched-subunit amino acid permease